MNQIFLGEPSQEIKSWFIETFPSWPAYTTLKFVDGTTQTKEINGVATWENIGVKSVQYGGENNLAYCQLGTNVTEIGDATFAYCSSLSSIIIPSSVISIGYYAFADCDSLSSISIPRSVTSIGSQTFMYNDQLTSVIFEGRTSAEITTMANYPWSIPNTSAIKPGIS